MRAVRWMGHGLRYSIFFGLTFCWLTVGSSLSCSSDINVTVPGCENCPDRCVQQGERGRCALCLLDSHCQSEGSPTKRCSPDLRCICGTDKDCPQNQHCNEVGNCVECLSDQHCTTEYKPICVAYECEICRVGTTRSCKPTDTKACGEGTQSCEKDNFWGVCKDYKTCPNGESCQNGACVIECPVSSCQVGQKKCVTDANKTPGAYISCVEDTRKCKVWDNVNVVACKDKEYCFEGVCQSLSCPSGQTFCEAQNVCINPATDPNHCGGCGKACKPGEVCVSGACSLSCPAGQKICGGLCTNLQINPNHCGQCGAVCKSGQICTGGSCVASCQTGLTLCNNQCVDLKTDRTHCGKCGVLCSANQICTQGVCILTCPSGQTNCAGTCVNLDTSLQHCGKCNNTCATGKSCLSGQCITYCQQGQTNCDGTCVSTQTHKLHCGKCNAACAANQTCSNGVCR